MRLVDPVTGKSYVEKRKRRYEEVGQRFWQPDGGYHRNITSIEALRAMIEYIHANPVRRGLVARAEVGNGRAHSGMPECGR